MSLFAYAPMDSDQFERFYVQEWIEGIFGVLIWVIAVCFIAYQICQTIRSYNALNNGLEHRRIDFELAKWSSDEVHKNLSPTGIQDENQTESHGNTPATS